MKEKIKKIIKHDFLKYGLVGGTSTVLDFLVLNLSFKFMGNQDHFLWLATAFGFAVGTVNGYVLNSRWTFAYDTKGQETKKFIQFLVVSAFGLIFTEIIVLSLANALGLEKNVGKSVAVIIVFFWNYFANKHWTFRKQ